MRETGPARAGSPIDCGNDTSITFGHDRCRRRLCENSVQHGQLRNDVLPQARIRNLVLERAAMDEPQRKLFSSDSRNWSFHTASAEIGLVAAQHSGHARACDRTFHSSQSEPRIVADQGLLPSGLSMLGAFRLVGNWANDLVLTVISVQPNIAA